MQLEIKGLFKSFEVAGGFLNRRRVDVLKDVNLDIAEGEIVGLVGESGSGKTTLARCIMGLIEPDQGKVEFNGTSPVGLGKKALQQWRREISVVYQNPFMSLNPRMRIFDIVAEPMTAREPISNFNLQEKVVGLMEKVGLDSTFLRRKVGEISGGQAQRVAIARAISTRPGLIILDEPTSALDVSVQAQILNLLTDLQDRRKFACLFITHDLDVVRFATDRTAVMENGSIIEFGPTMQILEDPQHEYTKSLIAATPRFPADTTNECRIVGGN